MIQQQFGYRDAAPRLRFSRACRCHPWPSLALPVGRPPYQTLVLTFASERRCSYSGTTGMTVSFNGSGSTDLGQTLTYAWNSYICRDRAIPKSDHTYAGTGTYRRVTLQQTLMCCGSRLERRQLRPQPPSTEFPN